MIPSLEPLYEDLDLTLWQRNKEIQDARGAFSVFSAANATMDQLRDWYFGRDEIVAMGVNCNQRIYGFEEEIFFSMPVRLYGGFKVEVVQGMVIDKAIEKEIEKRYKRVLQEKEIVIKNL